MVNTRNRKGSTPKAESYGRAYLQARKHEREKKKQRESQEGRKSTRALLQKFRPLRISNVSVKKKGNLVNQPSQSIKGQGLLEI